MSIFKRAAAVAPSDPTPTRPLWTLPRFTRFELRLGPGERPVEGFVIKHSAGSTRVRVKTPQAVINLLSGAQEFKAAAFHETSWSRETTVVPIEVPKVSFARSMQEREGQTRNNEGESDMARLNKAVAVDPNGPGPVAVSPAKARIAALQAKATGKKAAMKAEVKEALRKEKAAKVKSPCLCQCGEMTGGNFAPGHDARYFGWMRKVIDGRLQASELPKGIGVRGPADAAKILAQHGHA